MALELEDDFRPKRDGRKERGERTETLVSYVRERILDDIVQGRIASAEVFQLRALADRYGVSKTPVREALSQLQREGLVESLPYKGYMVRPMDLSEFNEIFHLRQLLEGAAAELAATNIGDADLAELASLRPPDDTVGMSLEYDRYSHQFHEAIARASGSRRLLEMFEKMYTDARRLQYSGIGRPSAFHSSREHEEIVQALAQRDPAAAREAMVRHVENIKARALESQGPLPDPLPPLIRERAASPNPSRRVTAVPVEVVRTEGSEGAAAGPIHVTLRLETAGGEYLVSADLPAGPPAETEE